MQNETVRDIRIRGDFFAAAPIDELEDCLRGTTLLGAEDRLADRAIGNYIFGMSREELAALLRS
jgi:hypothetical protein